MKLATHKGMLKDGWRSFTLGGKKFYRLNQDYYKFIGAADSADGFCTQAHYDILVQKYGEPFKVHTAFDSDAGESKITTLEYSI